MTTQQKEFSPDWVSSPGETIFDLMKERGLTQDELALSLECDTGYFDMLLKGEVVLSDKTALRLEQVLGSEASFWRNREARYRQQLEYLRSGQPLRGG